MRDNDTTEGMKLNVGDRIRSGSIVREITGVRDSGYTWIYVGDKYIKGRDFLSENSNDPFFEWGWSIMNNDTKEQT